MNREEVVVRILGRIELEFPSIVDQRKVRSIIEEVFYDYQVLPAERGIVARNNLNDRIMMFLATKKIDGLSDKTLKNYNQHLYKFAACVWKNAEDISSMDIRIHLAEYAKTGVKNSTIATKSSTLRSFFKWLEDEDYITKSPMRKLKPVKVEKRLRKALTVEEFELVREACKTYRQRALLEFLYSTGCRLEETERVNIRAINWNELSLKVIGKGDKERTVYLTVKSKVHIQKYLLTRNDDNEALFVTERKPHSRLGRRSIQREISQIGELAGIGKSIFPHLIRHTTATNLINNGADLATVQKILGHEDPATTQIYAEISDENVKYKHKKYLVQ